MIDRVLLDEVIRHVDEEVSQVFAAFGLDGDNDAWWQFDVLYAQQLSEKAELLRPSYFQGLYEEFPQGII